MDEMNEANETIPFEALPSPITVSGSEPDEFRGSEAQPISDPGKPSTGLATGLVMPNIHSSTLRHRNISNIHNTARTRRARINVDEECRDIGVRVVNGVRQLAHGLRLTFSLTKPEEQPKFRSTWFHVSALAVEGGRREQHTEAREAPGAFARGIVIARGTALDDDVRFRLRRDNVLYQVPKPVGSDDEGGVRRWRLCLWKSKLPRTRAVEVRQRVARFVHIATANLKDRMRYHSETDCHTHTSRIESSDHLPKHRSMILRFTGDPWAPDLHVNVDFLSELYMSIPRPLIEYGRPGVEGMVLIYPVGVMSKISIPSGWRLFEFKIITAVTENMDFVDEWEDPNTCAISDLKKDHKHCFAELSYRRLYKTIGANRPVECEGNYLSSGTSSEDFNSSKHSDSDEYLDRDIHDPIDTDGDIRHNPRRVCLNWMHLGRRASPYDLTGSNYGVSGVGSRHYPKDHYIHLTPVYRSQDEENGRNAEKMLMILRDGDEESTSMQLDIHNVRYNGKVERVGMYRMTMGKLLSSAAAGKMNFIQTLDTTAEYDPYMAMELEKKNWFGLRRKVKKGVIGGWKIEESKTFGQLRNQHSLTIDVEIWHSAFNYSDDGRAETRRLVTVTEQAERVVGKGGSMSVPQAVQYIVDWPKKKKSNSGGDGGGSSSRKSLHWSDLKKVAGEYDSGDDGYEDALGGEGLLEESCELVQLDGATTSAGSQEEGRLDVDVDSFCGATGSATSGRGEHSTAGHYKME